MYSSLEPSVADVGIESAGIRSELIDFSFPSAHAPIGLARFSGPPVVLSRTHRRRMAVVHYQGAFLAVGFSYGCRPILPGFQRRPNSTQRRQPSHAGKEVPRTLQAQQADCPEGIR